MDVVREVVDIIWRVSAVVGIGTAMFFGLALWRHNRKNAFSNDRKEWAPAVASAIEVSIQRSDEVGQLRFDLEVFHCPPRVPGKPVPYFAASWTSLTDGKCGDVHTLALNGEDPVEMIWTSLSLCCAAI